MNIRDAMTALMTLQKGLTITDPAKVVIAQVYSPAPEPKAALQATCFTNSWERELLELSGDAARSQMWEVTAQLFVAGPVSPQAHDIAAALVAVYDTALHAALTLKDANGNATVTTHNHRSVRQALFIDTYGHDWAGFEHVIELEMRDVVTITA